MWGKLYDMIKINCSHCVSDDHDKCSDENCLCFSDNHGQREICSYCDKNNHENCVKPCKCDNIRHGVIIDERSDDEIQAEKDQLQRDHDKTRLENFLDHGMGNNPSVYTLTEMVKLFITVKNIVSIIDITKTLLEWCRRYRVDENEIDVAISTVFSDSDYIQQIKKTAYNLGQNQVEILLDKSQLMEAAEWIKGRFYIKKLELTGQMIFFNDKYYSSDAEILIRRKAREILVKSKNSDMTEVVKMIEDSCNIISWHDIESNIHRKCLLNGVYDIKSGVFSPKFSPDYIILTQIPHKFNESASYGDIDGVVSSIITDTKDKQSFYDFISLCLHPYNGIDIQFGGVGIQGTGKSQLCKLVEYVLGKDNCNGAKIQLLAKDMTSQKDAALKMVNIDQDVNTDSVKDIDVIKKWITQDSITARGIYEHSTTFRPMSRLMFMANDLFEIPNTDDANAIYSRTHIVRIDKTHRGQTTEVKRIMEKVSTPDQLEGLITYLCKNATWIYDQEKIHHPMHISTVKEVWNLYGNRIREFVTKYVVMGADERVESNQPYNRWLSFCIKKGWQSKNKKEFSKVFDEIVGTTPTKTRIDEVQCYAYLGFRIKEDKELANEETIKFKPNLPSPYSAAIGIYLEDNQ